MPRRRPRRRGETVGLPIRRLQQFLRREGSGAGFGDDHAAGEVGDFGGLGGGAAGGEGEGVEGDGSVSGP